MRERAGRDSWDLNRIPGEVDVARRTFIALAVPCLRCRGLEEKQAEEIYGLTCFSFLRAASWIWNDVRLIEPNFADCRV